MPVNTLIDHFNSILPLSQEETEALVQVVEPRAVKRRQFILSPGEVCRHYHFIVEGCFKLFKVDEDGREHNLHFAIEDQWITDIGSFHTGSPSQLYIQALEPAVIVQIAKPDLIHFYETSIRFNRIFRVMIEDEFVRLQHRLLQTISTPAEARYLEFIKLYPKVFNRVSNVQIASYLGITPEFLSSVRSKLRRS